MDEPDEALPPVPESELIALSALVLTRARHREAAAVVSDGDERYEVAVAPGDRWVVQSSSIEWIGNGPSIRAYDVQPSAGARRRIEEYPPGWFHPALYLLWPHLLPLWGRPGDEYRPIRTIDGLHGPAGLVFEHVDAPMVGGESLGPWAHVLLNQDHQVTLLDWDGRVWTLLDINE
ncbi:hypothetical protein [Raineyella fluvialis]|uniref:Uncharacterized protein n=1 Tax=Raineyella fluvialis TaxID=2662261 RepID=A0A5Q2F6E3_9ACTN|nr:hypothetical protein [Raineyella fluvialis]QGF22399.1 hypothetical protein Rai3103_00405 [Raineyella fluvialis]